jgi:DNA-binding response OmpR family regulator
MVVELEDEPVGQPAGQVASGRKAAGGGKPRSVRPARAALRVLVADDSASIRESLAAALRNEGYEVLLAANGEEALQQYSPGQIDLVLLDLEMPVKSGWHVFEEIANLDHGQAIILMADRLDAVDLRTTGHLTRLAAKPIILSALMTAVRTALSESAALHRSTVTTQRNLLRYTKPFLSTSAATIGYDHWGINE